MIPTDPALLGCVERVCNEELRQGATHHVVGEVTEAPPPESPLRVMPVVPTGSDPGNMPRSFPVGDQSTLWQSLGAPWRTACSSTCGATGRQQRVGLDAGERGLHVIVIGDDRQLVVGGQSTHEVAGAGSVDASLSPERDCLLALPREAADSPSTATGRSCR